MTPEQFKARAQCEAAVMQMAQAQPLDVDGLRGVLMVASRMAKQLNLPLADVAALLSDEASLWTQYDAVKKRVFERRKEQGK